MTKTATDETAEKTAYTPAGESGVYESGYRGWSGLRAPSWNRWSVISAVGISRAWKSNWLKRMVFFSCLPAMWFGIGFYLWEQAAQSSEWKMFVTPALRSPFFRRNSPSPVFEAVTTAFANNDFSSGRHAVWAWLLQTFFRYPQAVFLVLIVGLVAPPLISQDIRSRAFLLYFSRPLTRTEYLLGKLGTLWAFLGLISVGPALVLYVMGVFLSPNLNVVVATWDLPLRIIAASIVLILPTSALALCLSSMTQESRYAGFSWFAIWILGWFTYGALSSAEAMNAGARFQRDGAIQVHQSVWTHLSLYHTLGRVQSWVFGFSGFNEARFSIAILLAITIVALAITFRRISAPMRA